MPDYSLIPVDYQPNFDGYSLIPVDYDPFAADGVTQQAQTQQPPAPTQPAQPQPQTQPQQPATGGGQPGVNGAAIGNSPSGSGSGGIGPTGGAPNPTLDQGAAKAAPFGSYSLVPVDYQPNFDGYSLIPVDYDPFAADGVNTRRFNSRRHRLNRRHHSRNGLRREPMSPASMGQRLAMAPANRAAALASSALAAPKVPTFRAAMRGSDSRARSAHGMLPPRK